MQLIGTSVRLADLRTSRTSAVGPQRPVSGLAVFFSVHFQRYIYTKACFQVN